MHDFAMAEDCKLWDIIIDEPFVPTKHVKVGDVTSNVPKKRRNMMRLIG